MEVRPSLHAQFHFLQLLHQFCNHTPTMAFAIDDALMRKFHFQSNPLSDLYYSIGMTLFFSLVMG